MNGWKWSCTMEFARHGQAESALSLDGIDFCGYTLKVTLLRGSEEPRPAFSLLPLAHASVQQENPES